MHSKQLYVCSTAMELGILSPSYIIIQATYPCRLLHETKSGYMYEVCSHSSVMPLIATDSNTALLQCSLVPRPLLPRKRGLGTRLTALPIPKEGSLMSTTFNRTIAITLQNLKNHNIIPTSQCTVGVHLPL